MTLTLAIDLGTGSCRAVLFDPDGVVVASSQREWTHPEVPGVPGSQVFDTARNWDLVASCIREAVAGSGRPASSIAAVGAASMREGMVLYDAAGREIWACPNVDSRAGDQARELVESSIAEHIFEVGGDWVAITSPARFRWIRDNEPDTFRAIAHVGMLSDWVTYRLTGAFTTDPSCGSSSNLFDLRTRSWSPAILDWLDISGSIVPEVFESGSVVGTVTDAAAEATGLASGTPVAVGGGDTQLGLVGIGVAQPGQKTLVGGSFWQTTVVTDRPIIDHAARVRTLCHAVPGQWMTEGIGFYSGLVMRWFRDAFCDTEIAAANQRGVDPYVVMEEAAAGIPPGSNGLLAIFSNVMQASRWVQAPPSFLQFDVERPERTGRPAAIRAIEEQAAFTARAHMQILEELTGDRGGDLVFTGGAAKGRLWPQIVADVTGRLVRVPRVKESTALGAAMLAGVATGIYRDLAEAIDRVVQFDRVIEPDPTTADAYANAFATWSACYPRVLALAEERLLRPMWWPAGA